MLIDTHCHLDLPELATDLPAIIARAKTAGVGRMITISTHQVHHARLLAIVEAYDEVFCTIGTHPNHVYEDRPARAADLIELAQHPKVIGFGETGLDYYYDDVNPSEQKISFIEHIRAARETQLPLIIHSRNADADMAQILRQETQEGAFPFILHSFASGLELATVAIKLGGYLSFSGILTFKNASNVREAAQLTPLTQILLETDSPYLAPVPHRGKTNEPAFVADTAVFLANHLQHSIENITNITTENAKRIFKKME
ncbi:TatD family hydrolase [Bartonella sp. DGB2]|uniref:TatD family hydrolase n=1 Tax=Bartonella sp. DGB2 TaxID=3388426 RepID=UPI003990191C